MILFLLLGLPGQTSIMPTSGTFRGIYHVNRAGVGRMDSFIFSKTMMDRMAEYEGQHIEVEILNARQPFSPGAAIIDEIGKVTRLPATPLKIRLKALTPTTDVGQASDVLCTLENTGTKDLSLNATSLSLSVLGYARSQPGIDDTMDDFYQAGYTGRQLGFSGNLWQSQNHPSLLGPGSQNSIHSQMVLLRSGETAPFVLPGVHLEPGQYELVALASGSSSAKETLPTMAALPLDVPVEGDGVHQRGLLEARIQVDHEDEWLVIEGRIFSASDAKVPLFTLSGNGNHYFSGQVKLYSSTGGLLTAGVDWKQPEGQWKLVQVDHEGIPFNFKVRNADRFSETSIAKITLETVTERGIEEVTLIDALASPPHRSPQPWGTTERGSRLRIRMARDSYKPDGKVRFFFQALSDSTEADMLWVDEGKFETQVVVLIDGKQAPVASTQLTDGIVYFFPFQGEVELRPASSLTVGRHTLQLSVQGDPGIYENLRGEKFRKLDGKLTSNAVEFEIRTDD